MYTITRKQQLKELTSRVPPVVNVDIVIVKYWKFLVGWHPISKHWLFPGRRMRFDETLSQAALRVLKEEVPGVKAQFKKIITVLEDHGHDPRAYGITLYYLFDFLSGTPKANEHLLDFRWVDRGEFEKLDSAYDIDKQVFGEIDQAVRTMNTSEDELLVRVDKNNQDAGSISKREAHANPIYFHRAAWIFIFNSKNELVLQQRGFNKVHNPGLWDMAGGHQTVGLTIEQTAHQELYEELGIDTKLTLSHIGLFQNTHQSEFFHVYYGFHDGPYKFDPHEVTNVKTFNCKKLLAGKYARKYPVLPHVLTQLQILQKK